ncbi:MAG: hypothetical protein LBU67_09170 [Oscillospiraceae bacterium]|jgi:enamine deaminase RidA (YjgF/YER057c/UK114 family)|nr:hypothetical protein [Oscillospiraceae bacterium]
MEIKRLDPSNSPVTYVRAVAAGGLMYFTDHVARPEYVTVREQLTAITARYMELFARFHLRKEDIVYALIYLNEPYSWQEIEPIWEGWMRGIEARMALIPSRFHNGRDMAVTLIVAGDERAAAAARADTAWEETVRGFHAVGTPPGTGYAEHSGVAYLTRVVCAGGRPIREQTSAILAEADRAFAERGLRKENLIFQFSYVADRPGVDIDAYEEEWQRWIGPGTLNPPSGVRMQLDMPAGHDVEITFLVAINGK